MKTKIFLFLIISFASNFVSAQRVLTDDERQTLLVSTLFKEKCVWAAKNNAVFLLQQSVVTSASTNAQKIRAVKDLITSYEIYTNGINDNDISARFLNAGKGKTFSIGAAPQSESVLVAAWVSASAFEEFVGEYFKILNEGLRTSVGN